MSLPWIQMLTAAFILHRLAKIARELIKDFSYRNCHEARMADLEYKRARRRKPPHS
jgi:hypothetical protein